MLVRFEQSEVLRAYPDVVVRQTDPLLATIPSYDAILSLVPTHMQTAQTVSVIR